MNHKVVSFYKEGLDSSVIDGQKNVFNFFNIPLEQIPFHTTHHQAIEEYINNVDFDIISICDIDLIPLNKNVFMNVKNQIDDNTIYGNAQASNSYAYVGPNFLNFNKTAFNTINYKSFVGGYYEGKEYDVGEMFSIVASKKGIKLNLSYPVHIVEPLWTCKHGKEFVFGIGTTYDSGTFHCYQIRHPDKIRLFLNKCNEVISV